MRTSDIDGPGARADASSWDSLTTFLSRHPLPAHTGASNWERGVEARQLIRGRAYGPDTLKVIFKAFDDAWDVLAPAASSRAAAIQLARLQLAHIILGLAREDSDDPEMLKNAALQAMAAIGYGADVDPRPETERPHGHKE